MFLTYALITISLNQISQNYKMKQQNWEKWFW